MSAEVKFIVPKDGQIVRDPISKQALPVEGLEKPWIGPEGRYWRRREIDGSISVFENNPKIMVNNFSYPEEKVYGGKQK